MYKRYALIISTIIAITVARFLIPNGVSIALLYAIPIFLSTPLNGTRLYTPCVCLSLVIISLFWHDANVPAKYIEIADKIGMFVSLAMLSYLGGLRCRRDLGKICKLEDINDHLIRRIEEIDTENKKLLP